MPRGGRGTLIIEQESVNADIKAGRLELPTMTCAHCNRVVVLNPQRTRPRNWCMKCDAYVCDLQFCITDCNPFEQSVELAQNNNGDDAYLLRGPRGEVLFDVRKRDRKKVY